MLLPHTLPPYPPRDQEKVTRSAKYPFLQKQSKTKQKLEICKNKLYFISIDTGYFHTNECIYTYIYL